MGSCLSNISASRRSTSSSTTSISHPKHHKSFNRQAYNIDSCLSKIPTTERGSQTKTVNEKESSLQMLPVEILQYISTTLLPPDAAASLALCSRSMLRILGSQAFHDLRLECHIIEKTRFLRNLEKDLSDWLFCHNCSMFHPVDLNEDLSKNLYLFKETECARMNGFVSIRYDFNIRYEYAQLIMRNYRLGRPYMLYLERLCEEYDRVYPDGNFKSVQTAEIVEGELLIHCKHTLRLFKNWNVTSIQINFPNFCRHFYNRYIDSNFAQTLRCRLSHANKLPCVECKKRKHCQYCSTSYQVDIRTLETHVIEVHVDVWRCLGSCECPMNSKWRAQAARRPPGCQENRIDQKSTGRVVPIVRATNEDDDDWEDITEPE